MKNKYTKINLKYIYFLLSILEMHVHFMYSIKIPCNCTFGNFEQILYLSSAEVQLKTVESIFDCSQRGLA